MSALIFALGVCAVGYGAWSFFIAGIMSTFMDHHISEVTPSDRVAIRRASARLIMGAAFVIVGISAIAVAFQ